jgi:hypothetical protein
MVIKVSRFDMLNNLEDFRATLDKMTMASQWKTEQNKSWEEKGIAECQETLGKADHAIDKA